MNAGKYILAFIALNAYSSLWTIYIVSKEQRMLSIIDILVSSWRNAGTVLTTVRNAVYVCIGVATFAGLNAGLTAHRSAAFNVMHETINLALLVLDFFILAAAVRTIRPDFQITLQRFLGIVMYGIVAAIIPGIAVRLLILPSLLPLVRLLTFCLLFVPGIWLWGKLCLTVPMCCLYPDNPLEKSYKATTHRFWPTLGLFIAVQVVTSGVDLVVGHIGGAIIALAPIAAIAVSPLWLATIAFVNQFAILALVRWSVNLVEHPVAPTIRTSATWLT